MQKPQKHVINRKKLMLSVKRSTHVIQQLLTLSKMVPEASLSEQTIVKLEPLAQEISVKLCHTLDKYSH